MTFLGPQYSTLNKYVELTLRFQVLLSPDAAYCGVTAHRLTFGARIFVRQVIYIRHPPGCSDN